MSKRQWIALFSQTGGELMRLSKAVGRYPDVILTDNKKFAPSDLPEDVQLLKLTTKEINEWLMGKTDNNPYKDEPVDSLVPQEYFEPTLNVAPGALITTHGYLRIIPAEVINYLAETCETVIYNGHPGLITVYPELKGKDPQKRVYEGVKSGKYKLVGSVIHIMDAGVDSGPVVLTTQQSIPSNQMNEDDVFALQYELSFKVWKAFLMTQFKGVFMEGC